MGLAASQARLLSLTARQHTVEGRAQYIQAQKLRLSNESDDLYNAYITALDATSLQTRAYDSDGKAHWLDGSFNNLLRYDALQKNLGNVYYVQDIKDNKLYMPEKINNAYQASGGDLFNFLDAMNISYEKDAHQDDYLEALALKKAYENLGYNTIPYSDEQILKYLDLKGDVLRPAETNTYGIAKQLSSLVASSKNYSGVFLPYNDEQYVKMTGQLNFLKGTSYYTGNTQTIIDYCLGFNIPEIFDNTTDTTKLTVRNNSSSKLLYISYDKAVEEQEHENPEDMQQIDDLIKLKMLLNGGTWEKTANNKNSTGTIYDESIQTTLDTYMAKSNSNIGDALCSIADAIMESEYNISKNNAQNELNTFLNSIDTTEDAVETALSNYNKYLSADDSLKAADQSTYTKYKDSVTGKYYEDIFNAIQAAGGCKPISSSSGKDSSWVNNMIKSTQVVLATYDRDKDELDNITASSNAGLREISNDVEITKADNEYEVALETINEKERKYDTKLKQLETERSAIKNEIESLKQIAKDNISSTFKLFS